jgi:hypothetical protein
LPFPSASCQTCKLQWIKASQSPPLRKSANPPSYCDETLPVCQRSRKSQRKFHGMRAGPGYSVIRIKNSDASGITKCPRGARSTRTAEPPPSTLAILQFPTTNLKPALFHTTPITIYTQPTTLWTSKKSFLTISCLHGYPDRIALSSIPLDLAWRSRYSHERRDIH